MDYAAGGATFQAGRQAGSRARPGGSPSPQLKGRPVETSPEGLDGRRPVRSLPSQRLATLGNISNA
jgi:hypothetical protein